MLSKAETEHPRKDYLDYNLDSLVFEGPTLISGAHVGAMMKEVRDAVDSTVSFGLKPKYLCSNSW